MQLNLYLMKKYN